MVLRRLPRLIAVLVAASALTFLLANLLPGDPASAILGEEATPEQLGELRSELRLDDPLPVRYVRWTGGVLTGDLGHSHHANREVSSLISERLPVSLEIMIIAQFLAIGTAVPCAILSASRRNRLADRALTGTSFALLSTPNFIIAIVMIYFFAIRLQWLPATGFTRISDDLAGNLRTVLLPSLVLATGPFAVYMRILRSDLLTTLQEDYILLARSQGLPPRQILWRHALRPSVLPLVTLIGINVGALIGGAVIVEQLFALPGMGRLLIESILNREYEVLQGVVLVIAVGYVLVNFLVDLCYGWLDPRIRHGHG